MALAADKSAEENRWVSFKEIVASVNCNSPTDCELIDSDVFPEGFIPTSVAEDLLTPSVDEKKESGSFIGKIKELFSESSAAA